MQRIASSAQGAGWLVSTDMHRKRVKTRDNRQPNGLTMTQAVAKVVHFVTGADGDGDGDGDGEEYGQFATKARQRMRLPPWYACVLSNMRHRYESTIGREPQLGSRACK